MDDTTTSGAPPGGPGVTRRTFLAGAGFLPLLRLLPPDTLRRTLVGPAVSGADATGTAHFRFFDAHQAAVVTEATARLIPGPADDPAEAGHPGAREAGVVHYIDLFLSAFDDDPPRIYAGGPWSDRAGSDDNHMAEFVPLTAWQEELWRSRVADLQRRYREGIAALDAAGGGDFATAPAEVQDAVLVEQSDFRRLLFEHAIEGTYAVPEYGGNRDLAGWDDIGFRGDVAPRGWTRDEVAETVIDPVPTGAELPFPPDMASGGATPTLPGRIDTEPGGGLDPEKTAARLHALTGDESAFFDAALPLRVRQRPGPRGWRR